MSYFDVGLPKTSPSSRYVNCISEQFPNSKRIYKVESSIVNKVTRDHLPCNGSLIDASINDSYIEFSIAPNQEEFIDCKSFVLELKLKITKADGTDPDPAKPISVIDNLGQRILARSSVFLNGTQTESNSHYGLYNTIKTYLSMGKEDISTFGRNMFVKHVNTPINETLTDANMGNMSASETSISQSCKNIIHLMIPINLDIASSDFYLINGVSIRMRFDLSPAKLLLNTPTDEGLKYNIRFAKLWNKKIVPDQNALISLNRNLVNNNSVIEYIHERPIIKSFVFPQGHNTIVLDDIFHGLIPHKLILFFIKQENLSGNYSRNGAYLDHCNLSSVRLDINSNQFSCLICNFPNESANVFHNTLVNIKSEKTLLTYDNFKQGRTIFAWDLSTSDCTDVLNLEKSGNIRLSLQTATPLTENTSIYVVGITNGLVELDAGRRVKTSYLM